MKFNEFFRKSKLAEPERPEEQLGYEGPDGELSLNPSTDYIMEELARGQEHWLGGSATAVIVWTQLRNPGYSMNFTKPSLHLFRHDPYGIHFSYKIFDYNPGGRNIELMARLCDAVIDGTVTHCLGGEDVYFPVSSFVSDDIAKTVVNEFLITGQPSNSAIWYKMVLSENSTYVFGPSPTIEVWDKIKANSWAER